MTPDTTSYMIAGFTVIFVGIVIYILTLVMRKAKIKKQARSLEQIESDRNQD